MALDFKDMYIKYPGHPKFNDLEIVEDEIVRVIVQKLEMILFTNKGEILGDPNFGADLVRYLHKTMVSADFVKRDIKEQIDSYIPELNQISYDMNVEFAKSPFSFSDIMLIDFKIREYEVNVFFS